MEKNSRFFNKFIKKLFVLLDDKQSTKYEKNRKQLRDLQQEEFEHDYTEDNIYDITDEEIEKHEKQMMLESYLNHEDNHHSVKAKVAWFIAFCSFTLCLFLAYIAFLKSPLPDYVFTANYTTTTLQTVHQLSSQEEINQIIKLTQEGKLRVRKGQIEAGKFKVGAYITANSDGIHVVNNKWQQSIKPITKAVQTTQIGEYLYIPTHTRTRIPEYVDKIDTELKLKQIQAIANQVDIPEQIKMGNYIHPTYNNSTYLYTIVASNRTDKIFKPLYPQKADETDKNINH